MEKPTPMLDELKRRMEMLKNGEMPPELKGKPIRTYGDAMAEYLRKKNDQ
jgi:hypothetical protein